MLNAMVEIGNESQIAFFAGAGVGCAQIIQETGFGAADLKLGSRTWVASDAGARKALTSFSGTSRRSTNFVRDFIVERIGC